MWTLPYRWNKFSFWTFGIQLEHLFVSQQESTGSCRGGRSWMWVLAWEESTGASPVSGYLSAGASEKQEIKSVFYYHLACVIKSDFHTMVCWKQACPDGEGVCSTGLGFRRRHLNVLLGECPHPQVLLSHLNGEVCLCVIAIFMKKCWGKECNLFLKFLLSHSWKSLGIFFTK